MWGNERASSALLQRNIARRVRQTASLVSGHDKIRERQGPFWAADCKERIIYWRVAHPFKPDTNLNMDQVLWLTIHEAAHLVMSAHFDVPKPPEVDNSQRFFRFWNAVEDIRIERWAVNRFPGKGYLCRELHQDLNETLLEIIEDKNDPDIHIADQVGRNFLQIESETEIWGSDRAKKFSAEHWDEIEDIVSTATSSRQVSSRLLPIYQKLMDQMTEEEKNAGSDEEGDVILSMDEDGNLTDGNGNSVTISWKGLLEGMARDASDGETKRRLIIKIENEEAAQRMAEQLASQGAGHDASGIEGHSDDWEISKRDNRGPVNILTRRLQVVLSHNAADQWEQRLKRGQFNSGHAHRSLKGDMKVFRKKSAVGKADYDFCITVDMSGSQSGREKELLSSCVIASEAIERSGMGLSIITWDGSMRHYKGWHSSIKSTQGIIGYDLAHAGGGTYEGYALRVAEEMIRHRLGMGREVFLITLTDGDTVAVNESEEIIRELEARGVKTIGIGVMHEAPRHYETRIRVDTGEELAHILPNLLRSIVKRG